MPQFMVIFALPEPFPDDFIDLIPEQRLHIDELMQEGVIQSYSLSLDRTTLWCIINAEAELDVVSLVHRFPLIEYMSYEVSELMFSSAVNTFPAFSLN